MKLLKKEIVSCYGCPYHLVPQDRQVQIDWCPLAGKQIVYITEGYPKWCPLPDKKEENNG